MAHNTSGLPKLDLEPFDPSDLYAAARSNSAAMGSARRSRFNPLVTGLGVVVALALAAGAAFLLT